MTKMRSGWENDTNNALDAQNAKKKKKRNKNSYHNNNDGENHKKYLFSVG